MRFVKTVENLFGLPQGFTRVEYLKSTGTQYIDTGIQPTDDYGYKIRNTYTRGGGEQCAIGCMDSGNRFVGVYTSGTENQLSGAWGSFVGFLPTYSWNTGDILDVEVNYKNSRKMIVGGTELKDISDVHISGTISNTLYLFARHYGNTITIMNGNVYGIEITNGQNVVADFIPCIDPLGVPCMYDLVGKKPYYNQGTGTFTVGRQIIPVEYLEGTGTQYIDTGLDYFADFEIGIQLRNNVSNKALGNGGYYCMQRQNSATPTWQFTSGSGNFYNSTTSITEHHVMKWKDNKVYSDDTFLTNFTKGSNIPHRMYLYSAVGGGMKYPNVIYFCKLWNPADGTLVRDFVPCKDENNIGFMFDRLSGTCYLNSGTGDFAFGTNKYKTKLRLIRDNILPTGYTQVEYLQSSGTQYINTGVKFDGANTKIELKTYEDSLTRRHSICGDDGNYFYYFRGTGNWAVGYNATAFNIDSYMVVGDNVFVMDKNNVYVNGVLAKTYTASSTVSSYNTLLFNRKTSLVDNGAVTMYYCKIWNNDALVRDFIPALDPSGTPCMYDMVSKTPFYNAGTGTFTTGKPVLPMVRFIKDVIPREYAAVNYISSANGNQYINTGYTGNSTTRVIIGASSSLESSNIPLFGARDTNGYYNSFSIWQNVGANGMRFDYTDTTANVVYSHSWLTTGVNIIEKNGRYNYVNGVQVNSNNEKTFSCNNPFYLMAIDTSGIAVSGFIGSVSFCKIYENNTLVRNFIPVVRRIDKVAGMWDTVTKQFYGNSGTGSFNYG